MLCPNRLEWLPIAFGALRIGAVLVPFSTLWKRDEIAYGLTHGDVALLLTVPRFLKHDYVARLARDRAGAATHRGAGRTRRPARRSLAACAARALAPRSCVLRRRAPERTSAGTMLPDDRSTTRFLDALERTVSPTDLATIFFTSGTTAQAKAVVHAHAALTTSARRIGECLGVTPDDAWWGHMPLFWSGGFVLGALATLAGGGRVVLQEVVEPGSALEPARGRALHDHGRLASGAGRCSSIPTSRAGACS